MKNTGLEEAQAGIKIAGRSITSDMQMTSPLWQKVSRPNEPLDEKEKVGLKLNIQETKVMTSGPITSWEIDGETVETVSDFILGGSKKLQMVIVAMKLKDA